MFHWICPECGREIPPSVKECPACDPKARLALAATSLHRSAPAQAESAPDPLLALAEHIRSAQADPHPVLSSVAASSRISVKTAVAGLESAAVAVAEPEPEPEPVAIEPATLPRLSITSFFPVTQAIALLAPPEAPPLPPVVAPAPLASAAAIPRLRSAGAPAFESKIGSKFQSKLEADPQPVERPAPAPLTQLAVGERPPSGGWLKLAPLQDYTVAAGQNMRPAPPARTVMMTDSGPRITLPGPALPPNLSSLQHAGVSVAGREPRSQAPLPRWLLNAALVLGIPLLGGALLLYFQPAERPSVQANAPAAPVVAAPVAVTHSLADFVEVTGFRFLVDFNKKSEIHYLVVNHSSAELSGMTVYVTLQTLDAKPGQPPLCRFSFRAPGLGPFESKEMTSPIEKLSRSVVVPDWQDLHAEVQVGQ